MSLAKTAVQALNTAVTRPFQLRVEGRIENLTALSRQHTMDVDGRASTRQGCIGRASNERRSDIYGINRAL